MSKNVLALAGVLVTVILAAVAWGFSTSKDVTRNTEKITASEKNIERNEKALSVLESKIDNMPQKTADEVIRRMREGK